MAGLCLPEGRDGFYCLSERGRKLTAKRSVLECGQGTAESHSIAADVAMLGGFRRFDDFANAESGPGL